MIYFNDDPLTRAKRNRVKRQKQAAFYLITGLILGACLMNLGIEFYRGVFA